MQPHNNRVLSTRGSLEIQPQVALGAARIEAVDIVRGVVMILKALDHTLDFPGFGVNPVDLATTS